MQKLNDLFDIEYGVSMEYQDCIQLPKDKGGIPFVSRTSKNNGIVGYVALDDTILPNPPHTISVACGGSVLSSFYQNEPYYSGFHILYLKPKISLTEFQMLYYCLVIQENAYKYNYGRQANRTLKDLLIPSIDEVNFNLNVHIEKPNNLPIESLNFELNTDNWRKFKYGGEDGIFRIENGYYNRKPDHTEIGDIPFIGATEFNNGITDYYSVFDIENNDKDERSSEHPLENKVFSGNCVTVSNNGSVGCAFYQEKDFTCSHDINVLYLKDKEWNKYIALFICTLIQLEKYRWAYGRKWRPVRMPYSEILLPVTNDKTPDWNFMESYIKSMKYSSAI